MSGHLGNVKRTTQNLLIVRIDAERQLLLIRGAVPGSRNGDLTVYPAVKPRKVGIASAKPGKAAPAKAGR
jgi:large subunit ribosomal protein L3